MSTRNNDLISRKAVVKALLEERKKYPPIVKGVQDRFNTAIRGGLRKALRIVETTPACSKTEKDRIELLVEITELVKEDEEDD